MRISVYMETLAYKYGGAEAYTANLIEALQNIFPTALLVLITERLRNYPLVSTEKLIEMQNSAYGTSIKKENFSVSYFNFEKIDENSARNKFSRLFRIIKKEINAIKRFKSIMRLSEGSDLFINASFKIVAGKAKKSICTVYFPYKPCTTSGINKRLRIFRYFAQKRDSAYKNSYDYYFPISEFTKENLKKYWLIPETKLKLIYPPVKPISLKVEKNHSQILLCSRICRDKKIDFLLQVYENSSYLKQNASLVVAGSAIGEDESFMGKLQAISPSTKFVIDPKRNELEKLYAESGIFWHAKGFGEENPFEFEHFGITTVEAMSAGCVPVVINKGGQKEIVAEGSGFRWNTLEELAERTEWLIRNPEEADKIRTNSIERSKAFTSGNFRSDINKNLSEVLYA